MGTGGGHGLSTTLKTLQNGIEIDLSGFKKPVINAAANTMVVGGGTIFGDVIDPLFEAKKEIRTYRTFHLMAPQGANTLFQQLAAAIALVSWEAP